MLLFLFAYGDNDYIPKTEDLEAYVFLELAFVLPLAPVFSLIMGLLAVASV